MKLFIAIIIFIYSPLRAQQVINNITKNIYAHSITNPSVIIKKSDLFGKHNSYIENIGQYGWGLINFQEMGKIQYGYEGFGMPVLFTASGIIHLQRKIIPESYSILKKQESKLTSYSGTKENFISMVWVNANQNNSIIANDVKEDYHTYGFLKEKAKCFKKLLYQNLYPGIDVEFSFNDSNMVGYEYKIFIKPYADIKKLVIKYGGDIKNLKINSENKLEIVSDIDTIFQSEPVCYYAESPYEKFKSAFLISNNEVRFKLPYNIDTKRTLVIDPFVNTSTSLSGLNDGIAKDIDFDKSGNIYIAGGGDYNVQQLAKFNQNGTHLWTFHGSIAVPSWNYGSERGGLLVDKQAGKIYLGQGISRMGPGYQIIRLNSAGLYDEFITTSNKAFEENWKMVSDCKGNEKIYVAGGGGDANNELAILNLSDTVILPSNITGLTGGHNDISDIIVDPFTNDLYSLFSVPSNSPGEDCKIYRHYFPYNYSNKAWTVSTGYKTVREPYGRPYLAGFDNSTNALAVNSKYVFFWDGKHLKAFNKLNGSVVGAALNLPANTVLMQGGIYADECGNVFTGSMSGEIKVYKFFGNRFDDNSAPDIYITNSGGSVYDLVYDATKNQIYACGNNFVAAIDMSLYCMSPLSSPVVYSFSVAVNINLVSAIVNISPSPPTNSYIAYSLFDSVTLISTNHSGVFSNLLPGKKYTARIYVTEHCVTYETEKKFMVPNRQTNSYDGINVPNAFTPNGDGINDKLNIFIDNHLVLKSFRIYNRFGQLIFSSYDRVKVWDGRINGTMQNTGTFVWVAELENVNGINTIHRGTLNLIR